MERNGAERRLFFPDVQEIMVVGWEGLDRSDVVGDEYRVY